MTSFNLSSGWYMLEFGIFILFGRGWHYPLKILLKIFALYKKFVSYVSLTRRAETIGSLLPLKKVSSFGKCIFYDSDWLIDLAVLWKQSFSSDDLIFSTKLLLITCNHLQFAYFPSIIYRLDLFFVTHCLPNLIITRFLLRYFSSNPLRRAGVN